MVVTRLQTRTSARHSATGGIGKTPPQTQEPAGRERSAGRRAAPIKSASRALLIFEYFDEIKRSATLAEISKELRIPPSSAYALLRSLVNMGYISHEKIHGRYLPTVRLAVLGNWINIDLFRNSKLSECMHALRRKTDSAVVLAARNGLFAQYIDILQATSAARLHLTVGALRPLVASGTGYAILGAYSNAQIRAIAERSAAENITPDRPVDPEELVRIIEQVRLDGYALSLSTVTPGGGVLATQLRGSNADRPLVLGIAGISAVLRASERQLAEDLRNTIDEYFTGNVSMADNGAGAASTC